MSAHYHEPTTAGEATSLLAELGDDAVALAGGTAVAILQRLGLLVPVHVVGLRRLDALRGIERVEDGLRIGALETHRSIEISPLVRDHQRVLAEAFGRIATVRIRNQATIGGNLAHADPAQDPPPILIALGASVEISGPDGERRLPVEQLFESVLMTTLAPGELITGILVPPIPVGTIVRYEKFLQRTADDYPTVSVAVAVTTQEDGRVAAARVALAGVGPTPIRALAVEDALVGERPLPSLLDETAALVAGEIDPIDDTRGSAVYKREMARVWTRRALAAATLEEASA